MKKLLLSAAIGMLAAPTIASADTIGFFVGGGTFDAEFSGDFRNTDSDVVKTKIDLEDDLGLDESSASYVYVAIEHPIPVLPNVKIARTELDQTARAETEESIEFDGKVYSADSKLESTIDLTHTDLTLYYELLDNWVNLDLGLTIRQFDGEISITGEVAGKTETAQEDLDFPIPLLYVKAQFDLPLTGLYAAVDGNWIGYSGNVFFDAVGKVGYETSIGLGVEAGIRSITLQIDDEDDVEADMDFSGLFLAAHYHF